MKLPAAILAYFCEKYPLFCGSRGPFFAFYYTDSLLANASSDILMHDEKKGGGVCGARTGRRPEAMMGVYTPDLRENSFFSGKTKKMGKKVEKMAKKSVHKNT